ncbi:hypothetical protein GCM10018779_10900 [Streptomyces griseocarneus]|nr:hypothetical protein GCM10018779_10900 [Streptomyces griseocarneus]
MAAEGGLRPLALLITPPGHWGAAPRMVPVLHRIRVPRPRAIQVETHVFHGTVTRAAVPALAPAVICPAIPAVARGGCRPDARTGHPT